jgi:hypothetical protein
VAAGGQSLFADDVTIGSALCRLRPCIHAPAALRGVAADRAAGDGARLRALLFVALQPNLGVILVGHSAGWGVVRFCVAQMQDPRVVGLVLASGCAQPDLRTSDSDQLRGAQRLLASGEGDALIRDPKRSFPSYISAATFLDIDAFLIDSGARDYFGVQTANAPIVQVRVPSSPRGTGGSVEFAPFFQQTADGGLARCGTVIPAEAGFANTNRLDSSAHTTSHASAAPRRPHRSHRTGDRVSLRIPPCRKSSCRKGSRGKPSCARSGEGGRRDHRYGHSRRSPWTGIGFPRISRYLRQS